MSIIDDAERTRRYLVGRFLREAQDTAPSGKRVGAWEIAFVVGTISIMRDVRRVSELIHAAKEGLIGRKQS